MVRVYIYIYIHRLLFILDCLSSVTTPGLPSPQWSVYLQHLSKWPSKFRLPTLPYPVSNSMRFPKNKTELLTGDHWWHDRRQVPCWSCCACLVRAKHGHTAQCFHRVDLPDDDLWDPHFSVRSFCLRNVSVKLQEKTKQLQESVWTCNILDILVPYH